MSRAIRKSSKRTRAPLPRTTPTLQPHLVDPVITLTASADRLLDEYIKARNAVEIAEAKLPARDRRWPSVAAPDLGLFRGEWSSGFLFSSERHIDREFQRVTKRLKDEIKQGRGKKLSGQLAHEYNERIARNQMVLAALPKFKGPLKRELRQEQRRLLKVQKKAGLIDGRAKKNKAWRALNHITWKIVRAKPVTTQGALAQINYVQIRLSRIDLAEFFSDNSDMPGHFGQVLRSAHQLLRRSIAA
jgi:hypothetical protein